MIFCMYLLFCVWKGRVLEYAIKAHELWNQTSRIQTSALPLLTSCWTTDGHLASQFSQLQNKNNNTTFLHKLWRISEIIVNCLEQSLAHSNCSSVNYYSAFNYLNVCFSCEMVSFEEYSSILFLFAPAFSPGPQYILIVLDRGNFATWLVLFNGSLHFK